MIQGWVKLHKRMRKSKIWRRKNKNAMIVLVGLMMCVEYERKEKDGYILEAGETDMTIGQIAEECMLTTKQTRAALDFLTKKGALKRAQLWAHKRAQEGTRTTLVNWALYQSGEKTGTQVGTGTGTQVGNSLRREEREEVPRVREAQSVPKVRLDEDGDMDLSGVTHVGEILIAEFDDPHWSFQHFKNAYPTGNGMGKAKQLWMALSPQDRARAYAGCLTYAKAVAATPKEKRRFIPAAGKWLDEIRWMDDIADSVLCLQADDNAHGPTRDISQMNSRERELCLLEEDNSDLF